MNSYGLVGVSFAWFIFLSALFLPKINFFEIGNATYLRFDDILVLFFLLFNSPLVFSFFNSLKIPKWFFFFILFIFFSFLSVFIGYFIIDTISIVSGIFFVIRHIEYFVYFFVGVIFFQRNIDVFKVFSFLVWYYFIIVFFQSLNLIPSFTDFSIDRASAFTAGPYEFAVILAFLLVYFYFSVKLSPLVFFNIFLCLILLVMTQSRITIFSLLLILFFKYILSMKSAAAVFKKSTVFFVIILFCLTFSQIFNLNILSRFLDFFNTDFRGIFVFLSEVPSVSSSNDYFRVAYDDLFDNVGDFNGDLSSIIRLFRWTLLFDLVFSSPITLFFGLGPSFASVAVDGHYVRFFIETGLLGLLSFIFFLFYSLIYFKLNSIMILFIFVLIINAFFIDIFTSSKVMFVFWFWFGYCYSRNKSTVRARFSVPPTSPHI